MAEITNVTYLMRKASGESTFTKLVDITSYPDMGGTPEQIDITTLSDTRLRNMLGLQSAENLEFGALYELNAYKRLEAIMQADKQIINPALLATYQVWFGENGSHGIFEWQGKLSVFAGGGEPNARREMTISISDEGDTELHFVDPGTSDIPVTGVTVSPSTLSLTAGGDTGTLTASIIPANATDQVVSWSSSDDTIASVSAGIVTPVAAGTVTITATTHDGNKTDTATVTVSST